MKRQSVPPHLPSPPCDPAAYQHLYAFNSGVDEFLDGHNDDEWREIRIPRDSTAVDVYRLLPSAEDFEYGGYLTKTRIRYLICGPTEAQTIEAKPCTFHSHPSGYRYADVPSPRDIYHFLKWRNLRAITVGADWIWVWTKDRLNLGTVRQLGEWEAKHMVDEVQRLSRESSGDFAEPYIELVLHKLGLCWPRRPTTDPTRWSTLLRESLGIKTKLLRR